MSGRVSAEGSSCSNAYIRVKEVLHYNDFETIKFVTILGRRQRNKIDKELVKQNLSAKK